MRGVAMYLPYNSHSQTVCVTCKRIYNKAKHTDSYLQAYLFGHYRLESARWTLTCAVSINCRLDLINSNNINEFTFVFIDNNTFESI